MSAARAIAFACGVLLAASAFTARAADLDKPAPELDVRLLNGKLMRWKDLRGKVVVNMRSVRYRSCTSWATRSEKPPVSANTRPRARRGSSLPSTRRSKSNSIIWPAAPAFCGQESRLPATE